MGWRASFCHRTCHYRSPEDRISLFLSDINPIHVILQPVLPPPMVPPSAAMPVVGTPPQPAPSLPPTASPLTPPVQVRQDALLNAIGNKPCRNFRSPQMLTPAAATITGSASPSSTGTPPSAVTAPILAQPTVVAAAAAASAVQPISAPVMNSLVATNKGCCYSDRIRRLIWHLLWFLFSAYELMSIK